MRNKENDEGNTFICIIAEIKLESGLLWQFIGGQSEYFIWSEQDVFYSSSVIKYVLYVSVNDFTSSLDNKMK